MMSRNWFRVLSATLALLLILVCSVAAQTPQVIKSKAKVMKLTADDYIEIQQLYANYPHALDLAQGERFANTFVDDGEFIGGRAPGHAQDDRAPLKGREALIKMGNKGGLRHFTANIVITPTAEGAKGSAYLLLFNARNIPATIVETAIYDDTLVKTPKGWKFKKRIVWRDDDDITPNKPKPLPPA